MNYLMIINWFETNYIEVLGAIAGLIYLYFSYNQRIWLWPFGLLTSALYVIFFYDTRLYADMSLQIYYVFISIYGWYFWQKGGRDSSKSKKVIRVRSITKSEAAILIGLIIILTLITGYFLKKYTNASLPYWDAFTTAGGVIATWMLARKLLENWLFWVVVDFVASGIYFYKGKYPTLILYLIYTIIAVAGYYKWKKDLKKSSV